MVSIDILRALAVATNSLRYNPEIDPDAAAAYEQILVNLRDELCREGAEMPDPPLTLEELREMDGEPVWVKCLCKKERNGWALVAPDGNAERYADVFWVEEYGVTWLAYRRRPEESETKHSCYDCAHYKGGKICGWNGLTAKIAPEEGCTVWICRRKPEEGANG